MADPVAILAAAREGLARARWLEGAEVLIADDLELEPDEIELVEALAARFPVRVLRRALPPSLRLQSFRGRLARARRSRGRLGGDAARRGGARPSRPRRSLRLREWLFEPPSGPALLGEAADAVRRRTTPSSS